MNEIQNKTQGPALIQRRHFLTLTARTGALAAMGALGSVLIAKRARLRSRGLCPDSASPADCRRCRQFDSCRRPRALSVRKASGKNHEQ